MTGGDTTSASVPIYCINLASSMERRRRMVKRFGAVGLLDHVRFVRAVPAASRLVDEHLARAGTPEVPPKRRAEVGCLLSHVRALRTFLRETPAHVSAGIVFEDDALLHREWNDRFGALLANLPERAAVCCLGYGVRSWTGFSWGGRRPELENLARSDHEALWGSYAYWFSRDHAHEVMREYPTVAADPHLVSEFIVARPGRFAAYPLLAIEDGTESTIRDEDEMVFHHNVFSGWGIANYLPDEPTEHRLGPAEPSRKHHTIRLCMIVRNEAEVIERCARSVRGVVDSWLICDTGSTDDTPARVRAAFADLPGELHDHEWKDFGTNRSRMLELARGSADYLLLLDADHTVRLTGALPHLSADAYSLLVDESVAHWVPRLVRGDLPWRYEGAAHEYLTSDEPHQVERLPELVIEHHADGGAQVNKVERNRELLIRTRWSGRPNTKVVTGDRSTRALRSPRRGTVLTASLPSAQHSRRRPSIIAGERRSTRVRCALPLRTVGPTPAPSVAIGNLSATVKAMHRAEPAGDPFDALGDPNRRAIVELLGRGGRSVREIADELPISRPAVSRHLRLLKTAGLVIDEAAGTRRVYRLDELGAEAVRHYMERVWGEAAARFRVVAENKPGRRR